MEFKRINKNAVKAWVISRTILLVIVMAIIGVITYWILISRIGDIPLVRNICRVVVVIILSLLLLNAFVYPFIEYREWRYSIQKDRISLIEGIFIRSKTIIPVSRIQHVSINQGPINKRFGLAAIQINTAGGVHQIPALTNEEAEIICENIKNIIETGDRHE